MTADPEHSSGAGRIRLLSHLSTSDSSRQQHQCQSQQQQHRLDLPRPLTAKRRLSGADQEAAAVPTGVEKPTIASTLRSNNVGANNNPLMNSSSSSNGGTGGGCALLGVVGAARSRRRSQRMAPLLPLRLRSQQQNATTDNSGAATSENGGGSLGSRLNRLSNGRLVSGAARGGGGAGRATNLCYYSGGAGAFGRNGASVGAPYMPKSAALGRRNGGGGGSNAGSRRASNSSGIGINFNGGGGGSTPGSRRSSQASIRSQGSGGGGGSGRKWTAAPVPTMLIDVQIQLPQSRHWPKWQRDRIANSLFGNKPGEEQWITLDELDEKMRQLLLLRPQSGKESLQANTEFDTIDEESGRVSPSRPRRRHQHRRASLRSRSPSPNGIIGNTGNYYQQQQQLYEQDNSISQQQLLLRIKAKQPATERLERSRRRPSISQLAVAAMGATKQQQQQHHNHHQQQTASTTSTQLTSGVARRKGSHAGLMFPHRWPSARAAPTTATSAATTSSQARNAATTEQRGPATQDLNSQAMTNNATANVNSEPTITGQDAKPQQQPNPPRRFHKVGFGRARAGRLIKTVSEQRFSFLGAATGGGRRGSTVTAIAAAAAAGNANSKSNGNAENDSHSVSGSSAANASSGLKNLKSQNNVGGGRICGDDPYTSQLRNRVHNAYYNPGPVDAAAVAVGAKTTAAINNQNTSQSIGQSTTTGSAAAPGKAGESSFGPSLKHSISTPSIVIDDAGAEDTAAGNMSSNLTSTDAVGVVGRSTLAAASALRGRKTPAQSLLQVPGFY